MGAVAVLGIVIYSVLVHGASALSFEFLVKGAPNGIGPAIVGTALIVALATAIAMPLGILVALYLTEFAGDRAARSIRLALDLMNGLPSIIVGLFIFGLLVNHHHHSAYAGSIALAIIMLPLIARGSQEILLLVPSSLREAADALGVSRWRTVLGVDPAQRARGNRHLDRARRRPRRWRDRAAAPRRLDIQCQPLQLQHRRSGAEHSDDDLLALRRS